MLSVALVGALAAGCGGSASASAGPLRIGVMLPLSGPDAVDAQGPLQWAQDNVNAAGGIDGRPIQFVYRDLARHSPLAEAKEFVSDGSVAAVIGPANSEDAQRVASVFFEHHKVMVTPSATSADLFRAFSGLHPQYLWRPVESDMAQMRTMLQVATQGGAHSVALVSGAGSYGNTFFDSFGFLATQAGLHVTTTLRYNEEAQSCQGPMTQALSSGADVVLAVPDHANQAICMARQWRAEGSRPQLLLSDAAQDPSLISALGPGAQGLEGTGLAPNPTNGFAQGFEARFHGSPTPNAANFYDSVLLIAYGLARSHGQSGAALAEAIQKVVNGKGPAVGWNRSGVAKTLRALGAGRTPSVHGAVGPWDFDKTSGLELVASTYELWRIEGNQFSVVSYLSTATAPTAQRGVSEVRATATPSKESSTLGGDYQPGPKTGAWALLVAGSDGWSNYRHQADVLAQYQRLRANGISASHIIVVSANDLVHNKQNPRPGYVPYTVGGPNLDRHVKVDYPLRGMTASRLMAILSGQASRSTPKVIRAGPGDDVYVYIVGHGNRDGVYLGLGEPIPALGRSYSVLTPELLDDTIAAMAAEHHYRRILVAVEACQGGVFGQGLDAPGALLLTAANPVEDSLSTNYDPSLHAWLADEFSYRLWKAEGSTPNASLEQLYEELYLNTSGSHVSAYGPDFGDAATVSLNEFITP